MRLDFGVALYNSAHFHTFYNRSYLRAACIPNDRAQIVYWVANLLCEGLEKLIYHYPQTEVDRSMEPVFLDLPTSEENVTNRSAVIFENVSPTLNFDGELELATEISYSNNRVFELIQNIESMSNIDNESINFSKNENSLKN